MIDLDDDKDFRRLTQLAAAAFSVPMAALGLPDGDRIRFAVYPGGVLPPVPMNEAPCRQTLAAGDGAAFWVEDAAADSRFATSPLVLGAGVRFYAGAPIIVRGQAIATLCVFDHQPRQRIAPEVLTQLADLAAVAASLLELKDEARVRARTAAELIKEEWRHALTLEAGKVGSWVWDLGSREISSNDIFRQMFDLDPGQRITLEDLVGRIHPEDRPAFDTALATSFGMDGEFHAEFRVNSGRWLIGRGRVYQRDAANRPLIMMGVNIDITDARNAADHTRYLLRELNHRVKNTLAMIQSLARQTVRRSPSPQQFIESFSGRLQTLAEAHVLLSDRDWRGIGLVELIRAQLEPYLISDGEQLMLDGEDLQLPPDHALGLGLILHELCSNAVKHGALRQPSGKVQVKWRRAATNPEKLELAWVESGGPPVVEPQESGFGSQLIRRSLDKVVDSHVALSFPPTGVEARIEMPLA